MKKIKVAAGQLTQKNGINWCCVCAKLTNEIYQDGICGRTCLEAEQQDHLTGQTKQQPLCKSSKLISLRS